MISVFILFPKHSYASSTISVQLFHINNKTHFTQLQPNRPFRVRIHHTVHSAGWSAILLRIGAFLICCSFLINFRNLKNMHNQPRCIIPSFDSLPYMNKDFPPLEHSMLFIMSHRDPQSHSSIDHLLPDNPPKEPNCSLLSIQCSQEDLPPIQKKDQPQIRTEDSFKVPTGRKKNGCVCKKTGCIKLYCECFRKGETCGDDCSCCNCSNKRENKQELQEIRQVRKKRSKNSSGRPYCNCRKTECQKKYCECFNAGLACAIQCQCNHCTNNL